MQGAELEYLHGRLCTPQWRDFLRAQAEEFRAHLSTDELRGLMHRIGARFAALYPLPACGSIAELRDAMNAAWKPLDWGLVELADQDDAALLIEHLCSPLSAAFGPGELDWTPAFLEGVYQGWMSAAGAGDTLQVRLQHADPTTGSLRFVFSK
ncbi:hypothetical protein CAL12_00305 [Bordetella genomosp. 8]|uniref:Cellulose synthase n=1 Tax=Bordetella genomosp. 8 TaxID=1416806 RepID=A0A1W6YE99_9BORD|nr:cellulose biosynthesis protein BcsD [Bordetella genomosp. 8]ARP79415.1 hypothetical protein CAL12_00305 [Bordetella genomosp. 8]